MTQLEFEYIKDLQTGTQPLMSHEPDSVIYNYFVDGEMALNTHGATVYGNYDTIDFADEERSITTKAVSKIGVKNFPGIGGIGFYKDAYSDGCYIVAPIHIKRDTMDAPILITAEIVGDKLHIVIKPPKDIKYNCYRVIVKQGYFAFEYITYKTDYYVDMPTVKGEYKVFCLGYDEDMGTVSDYSNELTLIITTGTDSFAPKAEIAYYTKEQIDEMLGDVSVLLDKLNGVVI